jgi:vacuolar-type H+-ATPase subunit E/Vma4
MKKETRKWITSIEDVAMEEAVNEFFDGGWDPKSREDTEEYIDFYIEEDFQEISDKEADHLKAEIKKEFDKRVNKIRQEEIDQLKDRKSILNWIKSFVDDWPDEGEVGYMLSKEEILDLILQNSNK